MKVVRLLPPGCTGRPGQCFDRPRGLACVVSRAGHARHAERGERLRSSATAGRGGEDRPTVPHGPARATRRPAHAGGRARRRAETAGCARGRSPPVPPGGSGPGGRGRGIGVGVRGGPGGRRAATRSRAGAPGGASSARGWPRRAHRRDDRAPDDGRWVLGVPAGGRPRPSARTRAALAARIGRGALPRGLAPLRGRRRDDVGADDRGRGSASWRGNGPERPRDAAPQGRVRRAFLAADAPIGAAWGDWRAAAVGGDRSARRGGAMRRGGGEGCEGPRGGSPGTAPGARGTRRCAGRRGGR